MVKRKDSYNLIQVKFGKGGPQVLKLGHQFNNMDDYKEEDLIKEPDFHEHFVWRVLGQTELHLIPGEVFRLGRLRFRVREHCDGNKTSHIGTKMNLGTKSVPPPL